MKELQYLNKYFIKYKYRFILGISITIIAQIFSLFTPQLVGNSFTVIHEYSSGKVGIETVESKLLQNILFIVGTTLTAGFLTFLMRQTLIVMSRHVEFDLKNDIFRHYEALDQGFYKRNRTGDLMNRITEDVSRVRMYVGPAVMYTINTAIRFIAVIGYMYSVSPKLTLYSVLPLPILSFIIFKISKEINVRSTLFQQNLSTVSSFTQEVFSGIRVVKAYALEKEQNANLKTLANTSKEKSMRLAKIQTLFIPLIIALIGVSNLTVIFIGGTMYIQGDPAVKDMGTIAEFMLYINMLNWPVTSLGWVSSLVQEAEASQKRINEFLKVEPEIRNRVEHSTPVQGAIEFKNVTYVYDDTGIRALDHVSFRLEEGKTLAIMGKTGSGKSTVLALLNRLYDVQEGSITLGNVPLKELNLFDLRKTIGIVPQDAFLFSDTIENNIRFGKTNATEIEVIEAAEKAVVHDNIMHFAEGYQTILGERGITLSGGQKQRVSIARALIKDPAILMFDDCLSAVDTETEEKILQNLTDLSKNKTTIIVSHRVSSAKNADMILILDEGKIIQQGTHNQLVNTDGYYKELYYKQLSEKEVG